MGKTQEMLILKRRLQNLVAELEEVRMHKLLGRDGWNERLRGILHEASEVLRAINEKANSETYFPCLGRRIERTKP